jgi:hypothetical protein
VIVTVALCVCLAGAALVGGARDLARTARENAALDPLERSYGNLSGSPNAIRDPRVVETALELLPPRATYALVIGDRWRPVRTPRWTTSLERDFLRYYLYPRREVVPAASTWIFCLACDENAFPRARARARTADGMVLLERE